METPLVRRAFRAAVGVFCMNILVFGSFGSSEIHRHQLAYLRRQAR